MISLNTYSFAIRMGLIRTKKCYEWKFTKFLELCLKKKIQFIEFPIDYFSSKEGLSFRELLECCRKKKIKPIIALEKFNISSIKKLLALSDTYAFSFVRVKMSNFFGGNRYKQKKFLIIKKKFEKKLIFCSQLIKNSNLKLAINNHQDLSSKEILNILKKSSKNIFINWDVGNSLATCETPDQFFNRCKKYIINVHFKDYKIILSNKGFYLKRTALGQGFVKMKKFIDFFKKSDINISVELAAHVHRHCDLFNKEFSKHHTNTKREINKFNNFIIKNASNENPLSNWEIYKNPKISTKDELKEFAKSYSELLKCLKKKQ